MTILSLTCFYSSQELSSHNVLSKLLDEAIIFFRREEKGRLMAVYILGLI